MWMNDTEYEFMKDSRDKKNVARSSHNARTHCGRSGSVRFPSDNLTKKEIKAMSGECIEYKSLKKPMNWEEFKELPNDIKKEYIKSIREKFGAPDQYIAEMFGVCARTLSLFLKDLNLNAGKESGNGKRKWEKEKFYAWRSGADEHAPVPAVVEETAEDSSSLSDNVNEGDTCSVEKVCAIPKDGQMIFNCPADHALNMIAMVLGNKNVELFVEWRVIPDEE